MIKSSLRLYQAAAHISKGEFLNAISRVCPGALQDGGLKLGIYVRGTKFFLRILTFIGLAVSGGVDSMALAVMCREYLPRNGTELQAFIVDHGLRPTSSEDAAKTKQMLNSILSLCYCEGLNLVII
jgi:hypothetical protein